MQITVRVLTILVMVFLPHISIAQTAGDKPSAKTPLWLAGCWEVTAGELVIEEHWMAVRGGTLLGMSRTVRGGHLAEYELLLLHEEESGWVYEAHPSGQPAASFKSSAITDTSIVFSNPDHDFPQTITYFRINSDSLLARISGERSGRLRQVEFPFRRVLCPGSGTSPPRTGEWGVGSGDSSPKRLDPHARTNHCEPRVVPKQVRLQ